MKIITEHEFCVDSPDYYEPIGAIYDDNTNINYIEDIEKYFGGKKISTLELGCAGGKLVSDLIERGHDSYGLEGTPHPLNKGRYAWANYYNKNLFNCDLSKPFELLDEKNEIKKFDLISHWEFLEHIPTESLDLLLCNIYKHLKDDGIVLCGISPWGPTSTTRPDLKEMLKDIAHHQSCFTKEEWIEKYFSKYFDSYEYPLNNKLRIDWNYELNYGSFNLMLKKKHGLHEFVEKTLVQEKNKFKK
jgi:2-polyprenyl-3-methyl-5-hydroxy-6-metoxy-1,4-benzoquinol methylase